MKNKIPLWFKVVYIASVIIAFSVFLPNSIRDNLAVRENVNEVQRIVYNAVPHEIVLETFYVELTGYGPDCSGCVSGKTASGQDVTDGKIYYDDINYGKVRIVAADKKFPFGTIVRITAPTVSETPIVAVVLDRGGKIKGNKIDLLFESEANTGSIGRQKNIKFEILRNGW